MSDVTEQETLRARLLHSERLATVGEMASRVAHEVRNPLGRHGLTPEEVEEAVFDDPDRRMLRGPRSERDRTRSIYYLYGRTGAGRYLQVVLLDLGGGLALPVTARDMTQRERHRYEGR